MAYALPFTHRRSGGHHGKGSDAQQQRKEEAEAGQEQEERRRGALTVQTRHLVHEPIRQEALAGDHCARPQRAPHHFGGDRANMRRPTSGSGQKTAAHKAAFPYHSTRALTVVRMSFVPRRIPYTCTAPEPVLELPRRDLARRTFGICCLYESCPA